MAEYIVELKGWMIMADLADVDESSLETVVRCKDCKHMKSYEHINKYFDAEWAWCYSPRFESPNGEHVPTEPDGFCAWGERRED